MFFYWLKTVTSCTEFCINKTHLHQSKTLKTVMSGWFFWWSFSLVHIIITTHNYYNDNKKRLALYCVCIVNQTDSSFAILQIVAKHHFLQIMTIALLCCCFKSRYQGCWQRYLVRFQTLKIFLLVLHSRRRAWDFACRLAWTWSKWEG